MIIAKIIKGVGKDVIPHDEVNIRIYLNDKIQKLENIGYLKKS